MRLASQEVATNATSSKEIPFYGSTILNAEFVLIVVING